MPGEFGSYILINKIYILSIHARHILTLSCFLNLYCIGMSKQLLRILFKHFFIVVECFKNYVWSSSIFLPRLGTILRNVRNELLCKCLLKHCAAFYASAMLQLWDITFKMKNVLNQTLSASVNATIFYGSFLLNTLKNMFFKEE